MVTISAAFALALEHYQAGQLPEAEAVCRQILEIEPQHAETRKLLESIAQQHKSQQGGGRDRPILISVSAGELIDKITILELKAAHISDVEKLRNVDHELKLLTAAREGAIAPSAQLSELTTALKSVNAELWEIEDAIRRCEQAQDFGPRFIELARAVYHANDHRYEVKRSINQLVGSSVVEEKSYAPYQ